MRNTSTLNLAEERNKYLRNKVNDTTNTMHKDFTLETQTGKPTFIEHSALLFPYSFIIKGYMSNIGPHLRHNQHHTFFLYTRTTLYPIPDYIYMTNNLYDY